MIIDNPYPLLFDYVYKDYIWGGTKIPKIFNRPSHEGLCAESWEISDRPEGMSIVRNGFLKGSSLKTLVSTMGSELVGTTCTNPNFPLLTKIIDSRQRLSVQVHPNDETAREHGGEAKTEMWYVLDAEPGAQVFAGLKEGTTHEIFETAMHEEKLEDLLRPIPVTKGSTIFIPGGRVHAIAEGCLLLEVQQNSNTTYRVYDWGRIGNDGKPRELHVEQALKVIDWNDNTSALIAPGKIETTKNAIYQEVLKCSYFHLTHMTISGRESIKNDGKSFHALFTIKGETRITGDTFTEVITPGTSCLLPASIKEYDLTPLTGDTEAILTKLV